MAVFDADMIVRKGRPKHAHFFRSDAGQARYLIHQVVKVGYVVLYLHMYMYLSKYVCINIILYSTYNKRYKSRGATAVSRNKIVRSTVFLR